MEKAQKQAAREAKKATAEKEVTCVKTRLKYLRATSTMAPIIRGLRELMVSLSVTGKTKPLVRWRIKPETWTDEANALLDEMTTQKVSAIAAVSAVSSEPQVNKPNAKEVIAARKAELAAERAEKAEKERIAAEQAEKERIAVEQAEKERIAAEQAEQDLLDVGDAELDIIDSLDDDHEHEHDDQEQSENDADHNTKKPFTHEYWPGKSLRLDDNAIYDGINLVGFIDEETGDVERIE